METFQKDILFTLQTHFKNISYNIFALKLSQRIHQRFTIIIPYYSKKNTPCPLFSSRQQYLWRKRYERGGKFHFRFQEKEEKEKESRSYFDDRSTRGETGIGSSDI